MSQPSDAQAGQPPAGMVGALGPLFSLVKDQRIAFLLVGAINTLVGTGWFVLFQLTVGTRYGYMASLGCAHVAAVLCAFVLYRRFVFRVRGHVWLDLARFEVVNLTALGINAAFLPLLVEAFGVPPIPAQLLITTVTMFVSWFGHRGFSFRRPPVLDPKPHSSTGATP
ncbi:GtrA family protein [Pengzhenrongella sicca]|uniref:GtrA family protein n=1 Tax=Pengzhenrongella sicca TaxID=2819238 RepID=A0A8A4ZI94_9MICO|nr:GtrA family protein [Pengzhenrongella sicca]QTE30236.1 GtrA family protein [Pengzhenrongella sicca]